MRTIEQTKQIIATIHSALSNVKQLTELLDGEYQQNHMDLIGEPSEQFAKMADILRQSSSVLHILRRMETDYLDDLQHPEDID